tara:strand:- start:68 stop:1519 length:1452 start_codon:yes stop_codon:yes gene_type:complete
MEDRSVPSSIDYGAVLPEAVPATQHRRKYFPNNAMTFSPIGNNQIRIELENSKSLLDPKNSYLEFEVFNADVAAASFGFETNANSFFQRLTIEQGGTVIARIDEYHRLNCGVLSLAQDTINSRSSNSLTGGERGYNAAGAANIQVRPIGGDAAGYLNLNHNSAAQIAPGASQRFAVPLGTGLFTQDKLLPLPLLRSGQPLVIVLDLAPSAQALIWNGPVGPNGYQLRNISYVASLIEVGRDVLDQFRMIQANMGGNLVLSSQDFEYNSDSVPTISTGDLILRCPSRHKSLKSMFWCAQSDDYAGTLGPILQSQAASLSYSGSMNLASYQLKVGSMVYPPTAVRGNNGLPNERSEMAMELAKAFGQLGWTNPTGILSTISYGSDINGLGDGDNGQAGQTDVPQGNGTICGCPFGLDLEAFQRSAIESGIDSETLAEAVNLIITIAPQVAGGANNSGVEVKTVHIWTLYDQHYYWGSDGMITFSN